MFDWIASYVVTHVELWFAGTWDSVWHKGVLYGVIATSVFLAFASQWLAVIPLVGPALVKLFSPLRKDLLWVAFIAAVILGAEYVGAVDARKECVAQQVVVDHVVDKAVTKAKSPAGKATKDPFDDPNL